MGPVNWRFYRNWDMAWDMNRDGAFTITDIQLLLKSIYFYPGDYVVSLVGPTALGRFLEMTPLSYGGWGSGVVSFFCWLLVLVMVLGVVEEFRPKGS
jgi:hypothetical protein